MKTILCYGDSLTWGYNPENSGRYSFDQRWTGVLQENLGDDYRVIEAGLNGRTTIYDDPMMDGVMRNGAAFLPVYLESNMPVDLVIFLLGTNDLKAHISGQANEIALGCGSLVRKALYSCMGPNGGAPQVLLLSPPHLGETSGLMNTIFGSQKEVSMQISSHYENVAEFFKIAYLDTAPFISAAPGEGVHLLAEENIKLGRAVAEKVKGILVV
ncbi:SGNH/GDSL hydrolase family protein [Piscirickettsia salmonis]|uniref:SGNH/GDSL hydrolase family protein n=1 Tax=Piscirickettsia salmonis TaxID=1238 RepID=UPI0026B8F727